MLSLTFVNVKCDGVREFEYIPTSRNKKKKKVSKLSSVIVSCSIVVRRGSRTLGRMR